MARKSREAPKQTMIRVIVCVALLIGALNGNELKGQDSTDISTMIHLKNLHKVDEGVYRGSQPDEEHFDLMDDVGIDEVLNLRRFHSDDDEAEGTDVKLHRIKIRAEALNEDHLLEALKIIKNRQGNILIHCHHGSDRTGAVVAMYRIAMQGWTKEDAIDEMRNGGYGFHEIFSNIPKLIEGIDIDEFKRKLNQE